MTTPELKPTIKVLQVTKPSVATSQLETAIKLWFEDGDPVSIHTLAVAAHDCLNALSTFAGKPSWAKEWLKTQSRNMQKRATEPQNFFKHGYLNPKRTLNYVPYYGELIIHDACPCFEELSGKMRPLMEVYLLRFTISHPEHLKDDIPLELLVSSRGFELSDLGPLSRSEFLKKVLPVVEKRLKA